MTCAGIEVKRRMISSSDNPKCSDFDIVVRMSQTGVFVALVDLDCQFMRLASLLFQKNWTYWRSGAKKSCPGNPAKLGGYRYDEHRHRRTCIHADRRARAYGPSEWLCQQRNPGMGGWPGNILPGRRSTGLRATPCGPGAGQPGNQREYRKRCAWPAARPAGIPRRRRSFTAPAARRGDNRSALPLVLNGRGPVRESAGISGPPRH